MIDLACVVFSTIMVIFTVLRAARLDRKRTWFVDPAADPTPPRPTPPHLGKRPSRR